MLIIDSNFLYDSDCFDIILRKYAPCGWSHNKHSARLSQSKCKHILSILF